LAHSAFAVSVNRSGLGQVLLYPYYTARSTGTGGAYDTLFTVSNTTSDTKVVRVRFRESRNGREVIAVNVYLGAYDSWTGAVTQGAQGGAVIVTNDQSCTDPPGAGIPRTMPLTNFHYTGANSDGEDDTLARTLEGYFEMFDLGVVKDARVVAGVSSTNGAPDCNAALPIGLDTAMDPPSGGLAGSANIVSVLDGTLYSYDATALVNFTASPLWTRPTSGSPTLEDVNPKVSVTFDDGVVHTASWDVAKGASPADPVSAVLMASELRNWFVLDASTNSATDWVVTMPTKPFYVSADTSSAGTPSKLFESNFGAGGAPVSFGQLSADCNTNTDRTLDFDREGRSIATGVCFLPPPPVPVDLDWTASVVIFSRSSLLNAYGPTYYPTLFPNGWAKLQPLQTSRSQTHRLVSTDATPLTYLGLPMIGFMANNYVNRTLVVGGQPVLSNYSATSSHKPVVRVE
jgi:hypothetical protein